MTDWQDRSGIACFSHESAYPLAMHMPVCSIATFHHAGGNVMTSEAEEAPGVRLLLG